MKDDTLRQLIFDLSHAQANVRVAKTAYDQAAQQMANAAEALEEYLSGFNLVKKETSDDSTDGGQREVSASGRPGEVPKSEAHSNPS